MSDSRSPSARGGFGPLREKLMSLGISDAAWRALQSRIRLGERIGRGEEILALDRPHRHATVMIEGVACSYERLIDGSRQIFIFLHPGDFCDLIQQVRPKAGKEIAVAAATDCTTGVIENGHLEELIAQHPSVALALWRAAVLEVSIYRERLLSMRRGLALQCVAHVLCEQLVRREAVGINNALIPLSQIDLADATGLSVVHINRTFKKLQELKVLSKQGRGMKVMDSGRLVTLAAFDGSYLDIPQLFSGWAVESGSTQSVFRTELHDR